jgi:hypothetical protein
MNTKIGAGLNATSHNEKFCLQLKRDQLSQNLITINNVNFWDNMMQTIVSIKIL